MNKKNTCSLIIATYNWPEALRVCLKSVANQSILPDEIIIADDGSREETKKLIEEVSKNFPVPIVHVWQQDEGFQLAKIRNKAFAKSNYEYLIQIDGDIILHKHFIKDHLHLAKTGYFITGSRAILTEDTTKEILEKVSFDQLNIFTGKISNFFNGLRNGLLRKFLAQRYKINGKNKYYVKGCNMSFWKKNIIAVNGYNEAFKGWGREDSELAIRLINAGIKKQFIKLGGICYHLHHEEKSRSMEQTNIDMMNTTISNKTKWIEKGINQYL